MNKGPKKLLVIGGSAGSLYMVLSILPHLKPADEGLAVVIVFHRKDSDSAIVELLSQRTSFMVKEAEDKESLEPNVIYLAPPDYHLFVEKDKSLSLDASEKINYSRPSIDATFETAAEAFQENLICVLLSGANADGAEGLLKVRGCNGTVVVQDPSEAEVSYMPQQGLNRLEPDFILTQQNIPGLISKC